MTSDSTLSAHRDEILAALSPVLFDVFAAHAWGRILVTTARREGALVVASIDVDDVIGPEDDIERAMGSAEVRASLPGLASAVDALCATWDVEVDAVSGGTFLRRGEPSMGFGFLPGLVRAPSAGFERRRDETAADGTLEGEDALARAVPFGTFARDAVTFTHAWANPSASRGHAERARALCDHFPDRTLWEIATPQFATDEDTAWAFARVVAAASRGKAVRCATEGGVVFGVLLGS